MSQGQHRREQERLRDGIAVEDATWGKLVALGRRFGVAVDADDGS